MVDWWNRRAVLALLMVVLGGRLWLVERAGSDLPLWDQWWVDFGAIVSPLSDGSFRLASLAETHNEHRLFFQRLSTLTLMKLSGRWEPREGLVLSAIVRALDLAAVFLLLGRRQPAQVRGILLVLLILVGALPVGTFNLLSGFQMQFFLGEPLAMAALALLCGSDLRPARLAGGLSLLLIALLNMATPLITVASAATVLGLKYARSRTDGSKAVGAMAALATFAAFIFWTTPRDSRLSARSLGEFADVLGRLLAWPFPGVPLFAILTILPPALLLRRIFRENDFRGTSWFLLAASASSLIQSAAIALVRARSGLASFPQYTDGLWLGQVVGFVALAEALRPRPGENGPRWSRSCAIWAFWLMAALFSDATFRGGPIVARVREAAAAREPLFARALQTGDLQVFAAETYHVHQMLIKENFAFFDDPSGRFAIPARFFARISSRRETFLPSFPAALVGAPPSRLSAAFLGLTRLAPLFVSLGLLVLASCLAGLRPPATPVPQPLQGV